MDEHFGPGVYARLTGLSINQLRRYDRLGHLLPDEVAKVTGRRWYRRSQIPQGRLLGGSHRCSRQRDAGGCRGAGRRRR